MYGTPMAHIRYLLSIFFIILEATLIQMPAHCAAPSDSGVSSEQKTISFTATATSPDGITSYASVQVEEIESTMQAISISQAKSLSDCSQVLIKDAIVTAGTQSFNGRFYIQEKNKTSGIGVLWNQSVSTGDCVTVAGKILTSCGERMISADSVSGYLQ